MNRQMNIVWGSCGVVLLILFALHVYLAWDFKAQQDELAALEAALEQTRISLNEEYLSLAKKKYTVRTALYQQITAEENSVPLTLLNRQIRNELLRD